MAFQIGPVSPPESTSARLNTSSIAMPSFCGVVPSRWLFHLFLLGLRSAWCADGCAKIMSKTVIGADAARYCSPAAAVPEPLRHHGMARHGLPIWLWQIGKKLFDDFDDQLDRIVNSTSAPSCHRFLCDHDGERLVSMWLVQQAGDMGIRRLAAEAEWDFKRGRHDGDAYGLRQAKCVPSRIARPFPHNFSPLRCSAMSTSMC